MPAWFKLFCFRAQSSSHISEVLWTVWVHHFGCSPPQDLNVQGDSFCIIFLTLTNTSASLCTAVREKNLWELPRQHMLQAQGRFPYPSPLVWLSPLWDATGQNSSEDIVVEYLRAQQHWPHSCRGVDEVENTTKPVPSPSHVHSLLNPLGLLKEYVNYRL